MIEQQVADRFRAAVADEPPLGFDPDDVIDRAIKRGRRRTVVWVAATATVVEAAVVWALAGQLGGAGDPVPAAGPVPVPVPVVQPPGPTFTLSGFEKTLTLDNPGDQRPADAQLRIDDLRVRNADDDHGTVRLKRGDAVVLEMALEHFHDYDLHYNEPVIAEPGVPVTLSVDCTASTRGCSGVSLTVTGYQVVPAR